MTEDMLWYIFISRRLLNPKEMKNSEKIFIFLANI